METKSFPSQGARRLIIDQMARDARVRGVPGAAAVQVSYHVAPPDGGDAFSLDGDTMVFHGSGADRVLVPAELGVRVREAIGELRVEALAGEVEIGAVHGDLRLKDLSGMVNVGQIDGDLRADGIADLRLTEGCSGSLRVQDGGGLSAEMVSGDVRLSGLSRARAGRVFGDLWAENLGGPLEIGRAEGDLRIAGVAGQVTIQGSSGDLRAAELLGGLAAEGIAGDADLRGPFGAEQSYTLSANGDVSLHIPAGADLRLTVQAAGRIRSDLGLTPSPDGSPTFTATLGHGAGRMALRSGGDLRIAQAGRSEGAGTWTRNAGGDDLGERIRKHVTVALNAAGLDAGLDAETGDYRFEMRSWAGRSGRAHDRHRHRAARGEPGSVQPAPEMPAQGPSTEEQMTILRMVEAGTISAAEAEELLKALGA